MAPTVLLEYTKEKHLKNKKRNHLSLKMMGKSQKFSKGYSSGFVPDYRHTIEMMGESEGFAGSGRANSANSSAPKRKSVNLDVGKCDGFNVPMQVISFSKISVSKRKELEMRLKAELEQVQTLQRRVSSTMVTSSSTVAVSSSRNGLGIKRDPVITGKLDSVKQAHRLSSVTNTDLLLLKQCEQLLKRLMSHKHGWVFNTPVDTVKLKIPDYFIVIKHPMDLGTVKTKITSGAYTDPRDFVADVRLTFANAMTYNPPGNNVHIMADVMSKFFETRWRPMEKKISATESCVKREMGASNTVPQPKKMKMSPVDHDIVVQDRVKPSMTAEEKQSLSKRLEALVADPPDHILEFLRQHADGANKADEIEIDIDSLSDDTLFELRKLLDDHMREKQRTEQHVISEPCEVEILNESGLRNSSIHPCKDAVHLCKGNEPADEDVDIGGYDPPMSVYPPVEIEKDAAPRNSKCSSSSSSGSDSGSTSSDSDSGSSSGSELEDRTASPSKVAKERGGCLITQDSKSNGTMNPVQINRTVTGMDHPVPDGHHKTVSETLHGCGAGENPPSERKVSPHKLYRATMLKSRFADTILKAREKTLRQSEKGDPEKMRREKEEFERHQREEKARLQAEAKTTAEACRRAEAEAAAEAKRRREQDREAARLALQKMEKTVDINENSLVLEELEMLRNVPAENLQSSVDETSPVRSPDGFGGFKLGGSNPLEQLGLFMKVDDEEEEEEAGPGSDPSDDVEEGEID